MKEINQLDLAGLRHDMRNTYKQIGYAGSLQVVYELVVAANTMLEVMHEETNGTK